MSTDKTITAKIRHTGISASHIFSTPATANGLLFNQITWNKMHVNLWDYFIEINGRQPFQNEEIVFHIPYDSILIAPHGYKSGLFYDRAPFSISDPQNWIESDTSVYAGAAAISTKGWNESLNNIITINIHGIVLGSFTPDVVGGGLMVDAFSNETGLASKGFGIRPSEYEIFKTLASFPNNVAAYRFYHDLSSGANTNETIHAGGVVGRGGCTDRFDNLATQGMFWSKMTVGIYDPVKNPAIEITVPCTVNIANDGVVLGGGGKQSSGFTSRSAFVEMLNTSTHLLDWNSPNTAGRSRKLDNVSINGGDAIKVNTSEFVDIKVSGILAGGGGASGTIGESQLSAMYLPHYDISALALTSRGAPNLGRAEGHVHSITPLPVWTRPSVIASLATKVVTERVDTVSFAIAASFDNVLKADLNASPDTFVNFVSLNRMPESSARAWARQYWDLSKTGRYSTGDTIAPNLQLFKAKYGALRSTGESFLMTGQLGGTFTNDDLYNNTSLSPRNTYDCSVTSGNGGNAGENATVSVASRWSGYAAPYGDVHTGVKGVAVVHGANTNVTVLSDGTYKP